MQEELVTQIRLALKKGLGIGDAEIPDIIIEIPKRAQHGDFSTSAAMIFASRNKLKPRDVATSVVENLGKSDIWNKVEIAGPGFINFHMENAYWHDAINTVYQHGKDYGRADIGSGKKIQLEFVSANPTGPLHIGHGRGAAIGDSLARILRFCGFNVASEYYINDMGNQIALLGKSILKSYRSLKGHPEKDDTADSDNLYKGDYINDLAKKISDDNPETDYSTTDGTALGNMGRTLMLQLIQEDLASFGVTFDEWFSEASLYESEKGCKNEVDAVLEYMRNKGYSYDTDGATWIRTTDKADDKDRVVIRQNGEKTYFASDIAYHKNKFERGFDRIINIWGADHHGYVARMKAVCDMLGYDKDTLSLLIVQLVHLYRDGKQVVMSKRGGEFITLKEVVEEVGKDAARFFFLMRRADSSLDFDLDLARKQTSENPVFYVQYAHARISSLLSRANEAGLGMDKVQNADTTRLVLSEEIALIKKLTVFPSVVLMAAQCLEAHRLSFYVMDLAAALHSYYFKNRIITDDEALSLARIKLVACIKACLKNGLNLIGVNAPSIM